MKRMRCKRGLTRIFCFGAQSVTKFCIELLNVFSFVTFVFIYRITKDLSGFQNLTGLIQLKPTNYKLITIY
jgi:hypothetical protein